MEPDLRRWLPSPAMVVAMIALLVALGGTAVAIKKNSIKGRHIAAKAVRGEAIRSGSIGERHVRSGSIGPGKLDLFKTSGLAGPVGTGSAAPTELGGPSAKVTLRQPGLIGIHVRAEGQVIPAGQGGEPTGRVHLFEAALLPRSPRILAFPSIDFKQRYSAPGDGSGVQARSRGGLIVIGAPAGTYTFSLRYSRTGNSSASFRNIGLWATSMN